MKAGITKIKVCFVAPNAFPLLAGGGHTELIGGAELQQVLLARALVHRGYKVCMVCWDFGQGEDVRVDGIDVIRACRPNAGVPGVRFLYPRMWSLWLGISRADADIYYQRAAGVLTGVVAAFCRKTGRKSVFAAAGNPDLFKNTPRVSLLRDRWIYEYGIRHVDRIVVQNEEQKRLCRKNYGRDAILVPNIGIEPEGRSEQAGQEILWVSTIRSIKRPELFLKLAEECPEYSFKMIGGPSSEEPRLYESIRKKAAELSNFEFVGFVPFDRIGEHFEKARLFVNTSESEGFPNTFLQAWSRSIPTISFVDSGATIDSMPVGVVVETMAGLRAATNWLTTDENARRSRGELSRRYFEQNHSMERTLASYEELFSDLAVNCKGNDG